MGMFQIFDVAGQGMSAQNIRLNTTASNMANASSVSSSVDQTYRARSPVFASLLKESTSEDLLFEQDNPVVGVKVLGIVESDRPIQQKYAPDHPMANEQGYIFTPNVNMMHEMANMISASRSYQMNIQMLNTTKQLIQQTIQLGR